MSSASQRLAPRLLRLSDAPAQPWRNGGGVTRELVAEAAQGPAWRWRVSVADITTDGPFSAWPGVQRWFAVVQGQGVELSFAAGRGTALLAQRWHDEPLCFDGASAPGCRLIDGATRDLNLMLRGFGGSMRRAAPGSDWRPGVSLAGIYAGTSGTVQAAAQRWQVPAEALLWFDAAPDTLRWEASDTGADSAVAWWIAVGGEQVETSVAFDRAASETLARAADAPEGLVKCP